MGDSREGNSVIMRRLRIALPLLMVPLALSGCGERPCATCGTVVVAAVGEPTSLLPPLVTETVGRDIGDLIYERLADLKPGQAPIDESSYSPGLASRWERVDSLTWRFTLRDGARWQDGQPVTSSDVVYSFQVYTDTLLDPPGRAAISGNIAAVQPVDSTTFLVRFNRDYPEQLFDATYHVRVIPRHVWEPIPRDAWAGDTSLAHLAGSGPYRIQGWTHGQSLILVADSSRSPNPAIGRVVWRFTSDPEAAANLLLSHEADLLETAAQAGADRLVTDSTFRLIPYPSAVYGLLVFRIQGKQPRPADAILGDRSVRHALVSAVDRTTIARSVFGPETKVPPGPISQLLWIWSNDIVTIGYDTAAAARELEAAGWRVGRDGIRQKNGRPLRLEILVPSTSTARRRAAEAIQAQWKLVGVDARVNVVDMPVMQQRLGEGRFDAFIGAWLDEPTPTSLAEQWSRAGWDDLNYGHYANPVVDSLLQAAANARTAGDARRLWHQVLDSLNADAPAVFLFAPTNIAAVSRRVQDAEINPYSWLAGLPHWKLASER